MVNNLAALHSEYAKESSHTIWMMKEAKKGYNRAIEGFEKAFGSEHPYYLTALSNQAILMFQEVKMMDDTKNEGQTGTGNGSIATVNQSTSNNSSEDEGTPTCNDFFDFIAYP